MNLRVSTCELPELDRLPFWRYFLPHVLANIEPLSTAPLPAPGDTGTLGGLRIMSESTRTPGVASHAEGRRCGRKEADDRKLILATRCGRPKPNPRRLITTKLDASL